MKFKQIISIMLIIVLITNLILLGFGKINQLYFWLIIIVIALIAYQVIPRLR